MGAYDMVNSRGEEGEGGEGFSKSRLKLTTFILSLHCGDMCATQWGYAEGCRKLTKERGTPWMRGTGVVCAQRCVRVRG